jgi:hypothetical protein
MTGNNWEDRFDFEKRAGRFYPVEIDYGAEEVCDGSRLLIDNLFVTSF